MIGGGTMNDFALILFFSSVLGIVLQAILLAIIVRKKKLIIYRKEMLVIFKILIVVLSISTILYNITQTS